MSGKSHQWPGLKGRFPFRLGTTSYIIPADIIPNVEALAGCVDDIELLLLESDEISNLPDDDTVRKLRDLAAEHSLSYTVHLPLDIQLGDYSETERRNSVDKCLRTIARVHPLAPFGWVVHFDWKPREKDSSTSTAEWLANLEASVDELLGSGLEPSRLCVETLDYPIEWIDRIIRDRGLSICLDVGHILLHSQPLEAHLDRYLEQCRIVHLHGVAAGKDHGDISLVNAELLSALLSRLCHNADIARVVTLEVFNETDFETSMHVMEGFLK